MDKNDKEFNALHKYHMKVIKKLDSFNNNSIDSNLDNMYIIRNNSNNEELISKKSSKKNNQFKRNERI